MTIRRLLLLLLVLSGCATNSATLQRELILNGLRQLNAAENQSIELGIESKIAAIDATMADNWEGWSNGQHSSSRTAERQSEQVLFGMFPDYQRSFELIVIDPPYANVVWTITGTAVTNGYKMRMEGSSTFEFNPDGKIIRSWLHTGQMPKPSDVGIDEGGT